MRLKEIAFNKMINKLLNLCQRELDLEEFPEINFVNESSIRGLSFGEFDGNTIHVVIKDRHPIDICRTLVHELIHWKQQLLGMELDGSDGSDIENQANAIAGKIMRQFGQSNPEFFAI